MDAALYSWHVATFFLGAVFAPLCAPSIQKGAPVADDTDGATVVCGRIHRVTVHSLVFDIVARPSLVRLIHVSLCMFYML